MNVPDNSKFESMVKNRPSSSLIPSVNKRLIAQYLGRTTFAAGSFALLGIIFITTTHPVNHHLYRTRQELTNLSKRYTQGHQCPRDGVRKIGIRQNHHRYNSIM